MKKVSSGYDSLHRIPAANDSGLAFSPNPAYEQYLKMHKVLVGNRGASQLVEIHQSLAVETMPRYLSAAGWAISEAAVVSSDRPVTKRINWLTAAQDCWSRALVAQQRINQSGPDCLQEDAYPQRIALDIACLPLFEGVVRGKISKPVRKQAFEDCMNVAQSNAVQLNLAAKAGQQQAIGAHYGLGFECNALLAYNGQMLQDRFAAPSSARSDSGYHHRSQTHDIQVVQHGGGRVEQITPVEIKSAASSRDRQRFLALLVRGKMHLSVVGKYAPLDTLNALAADYEGSATAEQQWIGQTVQGSLTAMIDLYSSGLPEPTISLRTVTAFRDSSKVADVYGGIRRIS